MDTPNDFIFLNECVADRFNPFTEGEYLVIQTSPQRMKLNVEYRTDDYRKGRSYCDLENMGHDYTSFGLRLFNEGKLWRVNYDGEPVKLSEEQNWTINENYLALNYSQNDEGGIMIHQCSYPFFATSVTNCNIHGEHVYSIHLITCLQSDSGREISSCPNCGYSLVLNGEDDDGEDDDDDAPTVCIGCSNYHGISYDGRKLICAIHPYGCSNENCLDFE